MPDSHKGLQETIDGLLAIVNAMSQATIEYEALDDGRIRTNFILTLTLWAVTLFVIFGLRCFELRFGNKNGEMKTNETPSNTSTRSV